MQRRSSEITDVGYWVGGIYSIGTCSKEPALLFYGSAHIYRGKSSLKLATELLVRPIGDPWITDRGL